MNNAQSASALVKGITDRSAIEQGRYSINAPMIYMFAIEAWGWLRAVFEFHCQKRFRQLACYATHTYTAPAALVTAVRGFVTRILDDISVTSDLVLKVDLKSA